MEFIGAIRIGLIVITIIYIIIYFNMDKLKRHELRNPLRFTLVSLAWCTGTWGVVGAMKEPGIIESAIAMTPFLLASLWLFVKIISSKPIKKPESKTKLIHHDLWKNK